MRLWPFYTEVTTTKKKPRAPRPRSQGPTIRPPREPGIRAAGRRHLQFWRGARRVLKPRKKGTFFGGVREIMLALIGLGLVVSIASRALGSTAGTIAGVGVAAVGGAGRFGYSRYQSRKADRSPNVWKPGQPHPGWPRPPIVTPYRPPNPSPQPPPAPTGNGIGCRGSCRKSKKPKSTCKCKAVPCLHGSEA